MTSQPADLAALADSFVAHQVASARAGREERLQLIGSALEDALTDVLDIFASGAPEARELLLLLVERVPEDRLCIDVTGLLIWSWLRSKDSSVRNWLEENAKANAKLRLALEGYDLD